MVRAERPLGLAGLGVEAAANTTERVEDWVGAMSPKPTVETVTTDQ